jgi:hypothetical protein
MKSPSEPRKEGKRRSAEEVTALLAEHEASGMRVSEFARLRQIPAQSMYGWLRARKKEATGAHSAGFASVVISGRGIPGAGVVTLRAALGWSVEVSGMDAQYVAALFKALMPCSR